MGWDRMERDGDGMGWGRDGMRRDDGMGMGWGWGRDEDGEAQPVQIPSPAFSLSKNMFFYKSILLLYSLDYYVVLVGSLLLYALSYSSKLLILNCSSLSQNFENIRVYANFLFVSSVSW